MSTNDLHSAATDFLDIAFNQGDPELAVSKYVGDEYIQHNPQVGDGGEAFIGFVHGFRKQFPDLHIEIHHALCEGAMAVTHSHLTMTAGQPGVAVADFFRFDGGKMVEHWDVLQNIPETSANSNGMF